MAPPARFGVKGIREEGDIIAHPEDLTASNESNRKDEKSRELSKADSFPDEFLEIIAEQQDQEDAEIGPVERQKRRDQTGQQRHLKIYRD